MPGPGHFHPPPWGSEAHRRGRTGTSAETDRPAWSGREASSSCACVQPASARRVLSLRESPQWAARSRGLWGGRERDESSQQRQLGKGKGAKMNREKEGERNVQAQGRWRLLLQVKARQRVSDLSLNCPERTKPGFRNDTPSPCRGGSRRACRDMAMWRGAGATSTGDLL